MPNAVKASIVAGFFALLTSCANAGPSGDVARFGTHEGPRFIHDVAVRRCVLTETQWEKQVNGARVLWEETRIDLRGAAFADWLGPARPKGEVVVTTMFDATDDPEKPYASITLRAPKGQIGTVEALGTRRLASALTKRGKTTASPRGTGDSHVFFETKQVLILFRGRDTAAQVQKLEAAINQEIARCTPVS